MYLFWSHYLRYCSHFVCIGTLFTTCISLSVIMTMPLQLLCWYWFHVYLHSFHVSWVLRSHILIALHLKVAASSSSRHSAQVVHFSNMHNWPVHWPGCQKVTSAVFFHYLICQYSHQYTSPICLAEVISRWLVSTTPLKFHCFIRLSYWSTTFWPITRFWLLMRHGIPSSGM